MTMLVNLAELLQGAKEEKKAIGAFNVYNLETILAVLDAAKSHSAPVIISFGEGYFSYAPIEAIAVVVKETSSHLNQPVVLHLDHAKELKSIARAIRCGFTSVMYDGSALPLSENIRNTKSIVEFAHAVGVSVEGELGYMNSEDGSFAPGLDLAQGYTRPQDAAEYASQTGIDALAVAVGNAHGIYKGTPQLDFNRLQDIAQAVGIPLVLHGCSGIPDEMIQKAVTLGVCKINVNTEVSTGAVQEIRTFLAANSERSVRLEKVLEASKVKMSEIIGHYIQLLR